MDNLQSRVLVATQTLNDLTGYSAIEAIKASNAKLEADLARAQADLRQARQHYKAVNARRASTQREVTTLLARKDTWGPPDLERFTTMYRQDHELEAAVAEASARLTEAEALEARLSQALNSGILRRYHEEQIWSDRIRRQSTWGTWGLMGVNILLFIVLQFVAEPWKRKRLMKGIAAEEKAALDAVRRELEEVRGALATREEAAAAAAAAASASAAPAAAVVEDAGLEAAPVASLPAVDGPKVPAPPALSWKEFLSNPSSWRPALEDLCSERVVDLRMRDVSLIALESAVTSAIAVAGVAALLARSQR
jgi:sensitive to high expression protein 9, mitochondrial